MVKDHLGNALKAGPVKPTKRHQDYIDKLDKIIAREVEILEKTKKMRDLLDKYEFPEYVEDDEGGQ